MINVTYSARQINADINRNKGKAGYIYMAVGENGTLILPQKILICPQKPINLFFNCFCNYLMLFSIQGKITQIITAC